MMRLAVNITVVLFTFLSCELTNGEILTFTTEVEKDLWLWFRPGSGEEWLKPIHLSRQNAPKTTDVVNEEDHLLVIRMGNVDKRIGWVSGRKLSEQSKGRSIIIEAVSVVEVKLEGYTVLVPHTEQRTGTRQVNRVVCKTKEETYTVLVPRLEEREGVRTVCRVVSEPKTEPYTVDVPYTVVIGGREVVKYRQETRYRTLCTQRTIAEEQKYTYTIEVMVPETRTRTVNVNVTETEEVPYTYEVVTTKPETRTREVKAVTETFHLFLKNADGSRTRIEFSPTRN